MSVEEALCLYERPLYRFCDNSAMEFLERNIFRYSKECYKEKQGAVRIHVARNPREEAMKAQEEFGTWFGQKDIVTGISELL